MTFDDDVKAKQKCLDGDEDLLTIPAPMANDETKNGDFKIKNGDISSKSKDELSKQPSGPANTRRAYITVAILCLVNLLNYMDRLTVAAVLIPIQKYFGINDTLGGLLQTVFIVSYMIFAPLCGYLGDRYSRKMIMIVGIFVWSTTVLLSSFVKANHFWMFFVTRGIVGVGEASYSTVSPTIIADLFTKDKRSMMLMLFYFAIPVGSGLGYIVGGGVSALAGSWQWGVRVTPILGVVCLFLLIFVLKEPERGMSEANHQLKTSSWFADLAYLAKNKTFIMSSLGFVCVAFVSGAVSLWAPNFVIYSQAMQLKPYDQVPLVFGFITCLSGFVGVTIGSMASTKWRKTNGKADPLVCGIGLLVCLPFYYIAINIANLNLIATWPAMFIMVAGLCLNWAITSDILMISMFIAVTALFLNWAVQVDMTMYVVIPPRRSTANAVQILFGHLLGDASSPFIVGKVSDVIRNGRDTDFDHYLGLKYALYIPAFILILGGFFFLATAWYIEGDKKKCDMIIQAAMLELTDVNQSSNSLPENGDIALAVLPTISQNIGAFESVSCLIPPLGDGVITEGDSNKDIPSYAQNVRF